MRLPRMFGANSASPNEFLTRNGELLLRKQISFSQGRSNPIRVFTLTQLQEATHNFDPSRRLGLGYTEYFWGILDDRKVVVVKHWFRTSDSHFEVGRLVEAHITEIAILSKIRHRNVLKLLGCCLETQVPALVYEFVPRRNLCYDMQRWSRFERRPPWPTRLQIAIDVGDALNYLHSYASGPIVHKNVHPESIFLDENYTAKLCNFSCSVPIPLGKTQVEDDPNIAGNYIYIDPVYLATGILTEKADVRSFGVVLMELLTGERFPRYLFREGRDVVLGVMGGREDLQEPPVEHVEHTTREQQLALEESCLAILVADATALGDAEGKTEQFIAFAKLALRCARFRVQERPTMKEVVQELRRITTLPLP